MPNVLASPRSASKPGDFCATSTAPAPATNHPALSRDGGGLLTSIVYADRIKGLGVHGRWLRKGFLSLTHAKQQELLFYMQDSIKNGSQWFIAAAGAGKQPIARDCQEAAAGTCRILAYLLWLLIICGICFTVWGRFSAWACTDDGSAVHQRLARA